MKRYFVFACLAGLTPWALVRGQESVGREKPAVAVDALPTAPSTAAAVAAVGSEAYAPAAAACPSRTGRARLGHAGRSNCDGAGRGECWTRVKDWLCFRPAHVGDPTCFQPTAYRPPLYNWFPGREGCGSGCAQTGYVGAALVSPLRLVVPVAPNPSPPAVSPATPPAAPPPRPELRAPSFGDPQAYAYPPAASGARVLPLGFRFAGPESPSLAGRRAYGTTATPGPESVPVMGQP